MRLPDGGYLLFKNKDFGRPHLDDRLWLDADLFGVLGMTTWDGDDPAGDEYSGFSIGVNRHGLLCCDSNVATLPGHVNYDVMTEVALREGVDVATAIAAIEHACSRRPVSWANLILIDREHSASVEIRGDRVESRFLERPTARSNHHLLLGPHHVGQQSPTSSTRLAAAQRCLDDARTLDDVVTLLASHDQGDTGVCNHDDLTTVYSYVIHAHDGVVEILVAQGAPCRSQRVRLPIPLGEQHSGADEQRFIERYPTAHKFNAARVV